MPRTRRSRGGWLARLRRNLRRWRYDHSEQIRAVSIGAFVVAATMLVLWAMKVLR